MRIGRMGCAGEPASGFGRAKLAWLTRRPFHLTVRRLAPKADLRFLETRGI